MLELATKGSLPYRNSTNHSYHRRQESFDGIKNEVRISVANFLEKHSVAHRKVCLSNPGMYWEFEKVRRDVGDGFVNFVGVERDWGVCEYSARWMPREQRLMRTVAPLDHGTLFGFSSKNGKKHAMDRLIHCDINQLWLLRNERKHQSENKRKWFVHTFFRNTEIFHDTFAPIGCQGVVNFCRNVHVVCKPKATQIPIAMSFLIGRDEPAAMKLINLMPAKSAAERRALFFKSQVELSGQMDCDISEVKCYRRDSRSRMGLVMAVLKWRQA